ncbi:uncharacterized protein DUF2726 [Cricetibacter osteomyelitidis]|uniref:Uncharacterized protein DUF2726 n=1 Tax=Cricetibacter osteomyelitidis TaxID=1521931 RepID=A0A4R2T5T3_9PAST|nr:DUF2726 domain-containing protein [Cricetibacter osteomyelitidis]TCP97790.1 uncharacterized protein DUF2726 [Cricetibacter osteomyelitidis]
MNQLLILEIVILVIILIIIVALKSGKNRRKRHSNHELPNALSLIANAKMFTKPLMNKSEYKLFQQINALLAQRFKSAGFRLFAQVSMGEFLGCENRTHFNLINSKRVDFLIIDRCGSPVIVIEYQGGGHFQQNAIERDAIKKEACRQANVYYLEIPQNYDQLSFETISHHLDQYLEAKNATQNQLAKSR